MRNGNSILIVDDEDKLRFRNIETLRLFEDTILVSGGLTAGERICISSVQTAVDGMLVDPSVVQNNSRLAVGAR